MVDLDAAFRTAAEQEGQVRQARVNQAAALDGLPESATVELSEPDRIQRTWRGILSSLLIAASVLVLVVEFVKVRGTRDSLPSGTVLYVFFLAPLIAGLILAIGWGQAKVTWGGEDEENDDEDGDENGDVGQTRVPSLRGSRGSTNLPSPP